MKDIMPQEIEVWDILPAIRRELAKILIRDHRLSQRETAKLLGITEPAVSQYVKSKRAKGLVFRGAVLRQIRKSAKEIVKDRQNLVEEVQRICRSLEVKKIVCEIHKHRNKTISKTCRVCLQ